MNDIVKRLRALSREMVRADMDMSLPEGSIDPAEAADEIERLREALLPFARLGEIMLPLDEHDTNSPWVTLPDDTPVKNVVAYSFTFGHFRAAARARPLWEEGEDVE